MFENLCFCFSYLPILPTSFTSIHRLNKTKCSKLLFENLPLVPLINNHHMSHFCVLNLLLNALNREILKEMQMVFEESGCSLFVFRHSSLSFKCVLKFIFFEWKAFFKGSQKPANALGIQGQVLCRSEQLGAGAEK